MKIFGFNIGKELISNPKKQKIEARNNSNWGYAQSISFDGEKNLGEVGPLIDYHLNYERLRIRSWQAYLESDLAQTILDRVAVWIVGKGLKLQCNPSKETLSSEGIEFDSEKFNRVTESRFATWSKSKLSSYSQMQTLHQTANEAFKNANIGGDVLTILRYQDGIVNVQNIDGSCVYSTILMKSSSTGNEIRNGIEFDKKGKHVAYWYVTEFNKSERIPAYDKATGLRVAFMTYGKKYKIDSDRGLPQLATSLESIKKTERYKEATVKTAEELAKMTVQVVHESYSDGETPFGKNTMDSLDVNNSDQLPVTDAGETLASNFTATTSGQAFNMPVGSRLEAVNQSNGTIAFKEFYGTIAEYICANFMIPPNVAFSLYNDSFSASRAATKDWEHTIEFKRSDFQTQWYDVVFKFWFHIQVLENKIQAPGYLQAFYNNNYMVVEAYLNCRFTGPMFPHIDPLKEVKAERAKLGELAKDMPLTTVEMSTELLNGGESSSNMEQFKDEYNDFGKLIPRIESSNPDN